MLKQVSGLNRNTGLSVNSDLCCTVVGILGDLDPNRPVPFRLTPNIAEFLTSTGVTGPLTAAMVASARCFVQPQYKLAALLRAVLRDEYITWHKKVSHFDILLRNHNGEMSHVEVIELFLQNKFHRK